MIPKTLHIIWIGDETKRPENCIRTWIEKNPTWTVKLWGNDDLRERGWINAQHMREMSARELNGVADMMRWEILYEEGGFLVDADSVCVRPLDDELLDCEAFACWENEIARPGLIAAGYFACEPNNAFVGQIILDIQAEPSVVHKPAWQTVGPLRLTDSYRRYAYQHLNILPSHTFIPEHFAGLRYGGRGKVYARQHWASTLRGYDELYLRHFDEEGREVTPMAGSFETTPQKRPDCEARRMSSSEFDNQSSSSTSRRVGNRGEHSSSSKSQIIGKHDPYFVQVVPVRKEFIGLSRIDVLSEFCRDQRVLHIGCADWPITDPRTSLHLQLEPFCRSLDGFDIHSEALDALKPYVINGSLFNDFTQIKRSYDLVLIPEVLEHVPNVCEFLKQLDAVDTKAYMISVPDAFQCHRRHFEYHAEEARFIEAVHPDHNCWYTPYTLSNTIRKYTNWEIDGLWFFNGISILAMLSKA